MRAVGLFEFGGPERLQVIDVDDRSPGPGEVVVRLRAAAVNPADVLFRQGLMPGGMAPHVSAPFVPGMDGSGVVVAVGEGVDRVEIGQQVMVLTVPTLTGRGTYAEALVLPAASVVPLPPEITHVEGATFLLNALTADLALESLGLTEGDRLLVTGATGGVGRFAVQLAKSAGMEVAAACASEDEPTLQALGVDVIISREAGLTEQVLRMWPTGVDGVVDAAALGPVVSRSVRKGGSVAALRDFGQLPPRGIAIHRVKYALHVADDRRLTRLGEFAGSGALTSKVAATYPLAQAAEAHRRLEAGGLRGRLVLDIE